MRKFSPDPVKVLIVLLKLLDFVLRILGFVLKMFDFVLKMMNFAEGVRPDCAAAEHARKGPGEEIYSRRGQLHHVDGRCGERPSSILLLFDSSFTRLLLCFLQFYSNFTPFYSTFTQKLSLDYCA